MRAANNSTATGPGSPAPADYASLTADLEALTTQTVTDAEGWGQKPIERSAENEICPPLCG